MENRWNAVWTRFMRRLDQYAAALAYDPVGDLHAGIAQLEEEVRALRPGDMPFRQSFTRERH